MSIKAKKDDDENVSEDVKDEADPFDDVKESDDKKAEVDESSDEAKSVDDFDKPGDILDEEKPVKESDEKSESKDEEDGPKETFKKDDEDEKKIMLDENDGVDLEEAKVTSRAEEQTGRSEHSFADLAEKRDDDFSLDEDVSEHHNPSSIPHVSSINSQLSGSNIYAGGQSNRQPKSGNMLHVIILIIIGLAVIGATVYFLKGNFNFGGSSESTPAPTEVAASTPAPTPVPTPSIERSKFKVRVLNGTSTAGLAATAAAKLKDLGYQIERTGNATNSAFTQTEVRSKPNNSDLIQQIIADLAPLFSGSSSSSALRTNDQSDAEVILGK